MAINIVSVGQGRSRVAASLFLTMLRVTLLGIAALAGAVLIHAAFPFTVDDSFITLRYSQNLANGYGPTYNPGSARAEGYTSFLWMVLLALPQRIGLDALLCAKIGGLLAIVATSVLAYRLTRAFTGPTLAVLVVFMLAIFPATSLHAVSGMETALYTLVLTALFSVSVGCTCEPTGRRFKILAGLALLVGLTRPEGNLIAAAVLGGVVALVPASRRRAFVVAILSLYVLPGAVYFVWRLWYYGELLPLPFYVKVSGQGFLAGLPSVLTYIAAVGLLVPLAIWGTLSFRQVLLPSALGVATLLAFFLVPLHIMGYASRYLFPVTPLLAVCAAIGLQRAAVSLAMRTPRHLALTILVLVTCGLLAVDAQRTLLPLAQASEYAADLEAAHLPLGRFLGGFGYGETMTIAIGDAGAIPYFSRWRTIDLYGLNDAHIAKRKQDPAYVFAQNPDLVVLVSVKSGRYVAHVAEQGLYERALLVGFRPIGTLEFTTNYDLWLLARPESAIAQQLVAWPRLQHRDVAVSRYPAAAP